MPEKITDSVEAIEVEAEKILGEAMTKANEIILEAKAEAQRILSSPLPLDEIKTERGRIVNKAKAEADEKIKDSEKKAAEISLNADKKVKDITELVVNIITGRS